MLSSAKSLLSIGARFSNRNFSTRRIPLVSSVKPLWPNLPVPTEVIESIPQRTIPDEKLNFSMSSRLDNRKLTCFPHLKYHPADLKVVVTVGVDELGLCEDELNIFCKLVGPRFNCGKRIVKLTCSRFPEKLENKKFLNLQLEQLVAEAKKIVRENPEEIANMKYAKRQYEKLYPRAAPTTAA